jgi:hypothetical protein
VNEYESLVQERPSGRTASGARPKGRFVDKSPEHRVALDRVRGWTRERFKLSPEATIVVSEIACTVPGCPPLETVVAFWTDDKRHHFKIFKPVAAAIVDDLPFAWLKDSLVAYDGYDCECC